MGAFEARLLTRNPWVPRRPISVREYHQMADIGILHEDDRVELIEGEIVAMTPIGTGHAGVSNSLTRALVMAVGDRGVSRRAIRWCWTMKTSRNLISWC